MTASAQKGYVGMAMEGPIATWYAKNTGKMRDDYRAAAQLIVRRLPPGAAVLEVAPGPGYLAVELARLGDFKITGLEISRSFVEIAQRVAQEAGVAVDFQQGDGSQMPFPDAAFDFAVCRSALKNFSRPVEALNEMRRVLKPGGVGLIQDLRGGSSRAEIDAAVDAMGLPWLDRWMTRWTFHNMLIKRAFTPAEMQALVAQSAFRECRIETHGIEMNVWLKKQGDGGAAN